MRLTPPRDLPAPGRRQTLYVALRLLQSPVFLVNSRLGRFAAAPRSSRSESSHRRGHPFSLSYGVVVPSSLTMVLPIASVCSTCPPVSVLVRAPAALPRGFSRRHGVCCFTQSLRRRASPCCSRNFARLRAARFHGDVQNPASISFRVAPSVVSEQPAVQECLPAVHRLRLAASP